MKSLTRYVYYIYIATVFACVNIWAAPSPTKKEVGDHTKATVLVMAKGSEGSGVAVKKGSTTLIWTNAHVVANNFASSTVVDPMTGLSKVVYTFSDVQVGQEENDGSRKVGDVRRVAKIVRYSPRHDLAVLKLYKGSWPEGSVEFSKTIPAQGDEVWHVGSMWGRQGISSVNEGIISFAGRPRDGHMPVELNGLPYDQVSITAVPGCSGGGVFLKKDGLCIGLMSEYLRGQVQGSMCIVPSRRMWEFAKEAKCIWAINPASPLPLEDNEHIMRDEVAPPAPPPPIQQGVPPPIPPPHFGPRP